MIYADFESLNVPVDVDNVDNVDGDNVDDDNVDDDGDDAEHEVDADAEHSGEEGDTTARPNHPAAAVQQPQQAQQHGMLIKRAYQEHKPISIGMKLVSAIPGVLDAVPYETYTGTDVSEWFSRRLLEYEEMCTTYLFDEARTV